MKKMNFASVSCEIAVADNFYFSTESICEYGRDTVRYAVERHVPSQKAGCPR